MPRPRVVIVGGGFAGLRAARHLGNAPVDVTLVDRRNHHLFQPLLYQVATAGLNPSDIAYPIRRILRRQANTEVVMGEVIGVEVEAHTLHLADGSTLGYDWLILAAGATHSYFGHDEWASDAPGLKTIEDALEIRRRVLSAFEAAERSGDPAEQARLLTFVIIGAGPTGVELAGAIVEIATRTLAGDFRHIDTRSTRVILVEGLDRILTAYPPSLSEKGRRQLERLGVDVRLSTRVTDVDGHGVVTESGPIEAGTVLWAAGVAASPLAEGLGAELDRSGRVVVEPDLSVPGHPEVFVVGDLAGATTAGAELAGVAPAAMQEGRHAAEVIRAVLAGRPRPAYRYRDKGTLATIGRSRAVGVIGPVRLSGFPAWVSWWAIHVLYLIGFRNRLLVMFDWAWNYVTFQRGARLITRRD